MSFWLRYLCPVRLRFGVNRGFPCTCYRSTSRTHLAQCASALSGRPSSAVLGLGVPSLGVVCCFRSRPGSVGAVWTTPVGSASAPAAGRVLVRDALVVSMRHRFHQRTGGGRAAAPGKGIADPAVCADRLSHATWAGDSVLVSEVLAELPCVASTLPWGKCICAAPSDPPESALLELTSATLWC